MYGILCNRGECATYGLVTDGPNDCKHVVYTEVDGVCHLGLENVPNTWDYKTPAAAGTEIRYHKEGLYIVV